MPAIIAWVMLALRIVLLAKLGNFIAGVFVFFGLQLVARKYGVEPLIQYMRQIAMTGGAEALSWMAFFNIDRYITVILSAYTIIAAKGIFLRRTGMGS